MRKLELCQCTSMSSSQADPALVAAFAPGGTLRASLNLGNPVLANMDPVTGEPVGVSIDLAREFARRLGVKIELVTFEKAAASAETLRNDNADIGFFAVDPARSEGLMFTAPYVLIEGSYLVPESSALTGNPQIDSTGNRIAVGAGSAYDLFLTREIRQAEIVRFPGAEPALAAVRTGDVEVAARHPPGARSRNTARTGGARTAGAFHGNPAGHGHSSQPRRPGACAAGRVR